MTTELIQLYDTVSEKIGKEGATALANYITKFTNERLNKNFDNLVSKTEFHQEVAEIRMDIANVRTEVKNVHSELKQDIAELRAEIANVRSELKQDIAEVRTEIANVRSELKQDIAEIRNDMTILGVMDKNEAVKLCNPLFYLPLQTFENMNKKSAFTVVVK